MQRVASAAGADPKTVSVTPMGLGWPFLLDEGIGGVKPKKDNPRIPEPLI